MPAYRFVETDDRIIERIVDDENLVINHIVLPRGEGVPAHDANSNAYLVILRGLITLDLEGEVQEWAAGSIVSIAFGTRMKISNDQEDTAEFFVVKAPNPREMRTHH